MANVATQALEPAGSRGRRHASWPVFVPQLAQHLTIDVTLLRLAFFLLSFVWGLGLLLYGVLWLLLPAPDTHTGRGLRGTVRSNMKSMGADLSASARIVSRA